MKKFFYTLLMLTSVSAFAEKKYSCDFKGPNGVLTVYDNYTVTLEIPGKDLECQFGVTTFPGTEVDMRVLNCQQGSKHTMYYYTELHGDIILSKGLVWSQDIMCRRVK